MGLIALLLACEPGSADDKCEAPCAGHTATNDTGQPDSGHVDTGAAPDTGDRGDSADTGDSAGTDADGDGAFTPDDCDDAEPEVFPGALDYCDGFDQDCDGDPVGAGMCSEWASTAQLQTLYWVGEEVDESFFARPLAVFDGALMNEVTVWDHARAAWAWGVFEGLPDDTHRWSDRVAGTWAGRWGYEVQNVRPAGDFDGDGSDDLWVWTTEYGPQRSDYRLVRGPYTDWPAAGAYGDEADEAVWYETAGEPLALEMLEATAGDIDGDGFADIAQAGDRGVTLLFGREDAVGNHDVREEAWIAEDVPLYGVQHAHVGPDFGGDGAREVMLLVSNEYDVFPWLDGSELRGAAGMPRTTTQRTVAVAHGYAAMLSSPPADVGDLDGDGAGDVMLGIGDDSENEPTCLAWVSGGALPTAAWIEDATLAKACWYGNDSSQAYPGRGDIDTDGVLDPWFYAFDGEIYYETGFSNGICPFGTSRLELGGTVDASAVSPCYDGIGISVPDQDGDGLADYWGLDEDWLDADTESLGRSDILLGFEIPWDDPSKW